MINPIKIYFERSDKIMSVLGYAKGIIVSLFCCSFSSFLVQGINLISKLNNNIFNSILFIVFTCVLLCKVSYEIFDIENKYNQLKK